MGSNRLFRYSTKAATVPTVTMSADTNAPPMPTMSAMPATPANSTIGKYFAEMRTVSMLASYCASFVSWKRRVNARSRANACTTRTPAKPSWSVERFWPMRSRTNRYALFDALRNQRLAITTGGTTTSVHSASFQLIRKITRIAPTKSRPFCTNMTRPICTSSCRASMSEVMRSDELAGLLALEEVHAEGHQVPEHARTEVAQE